MRLVHQRVAPDRAGAGLFLQNVESSPEANPNCSATYAMSLRLIDVSSVNTKDLEL